MRRGSAWVLGGALGLVVGCKDDPAIGSSGSSGPDPAETSGESGSQDDTGTSTGGDEVESAIVTHEFPPAALAPFEESLPCISWTLDNEAPLYVQGVTLVNNGGFHHSNGFVVPDTLYEGPDGVWDCGERGFNTLEAATAGTVLFAQSTQSWVEEQRFNDGAVVKIPAGHRVVAELHLLNLTAHDFDATLRMSLELLHPRHVEAVLTPFAVQYTDLELPPMTESRVTAVCDDFVDRAATNTAPFKIHWLLPHYHYLGNYFAFEVLGGPDDGQRLHEITGFDASPVGKRFDPPVDLSGAQGIRMTCGFDNWTDQTIGWGIGIDEMCIAFGFAESPFITQAGVGSGQPVGQDGGILRFEGGCLTIAAPKQPEQGPPTQQEIDGELYVPPIDPADEDLPPIPECEDTPADATPLLAPTLSNLREHVLPACGFSSCHGSGGQAAGLDLAAVDLHAELLGHPVVDDTDLPLVEPGDPEGSWLYHKLSRCVPRGRAGQALSHMPVNSPFLLEPGLTAMVREWIAAGAADD